MSKPHHWLSDGASTLGLRVRGERGSQVWRRDNEESDTRLTRQPVFSQGGKLVGHYPVYGWLRVKTAFNIGRLLQEVVVRS